jgi:uncharacterized RDD family membrane protein YckC
MNEKILDSGLIENEFVYQDNLTAIERLKSMLLDHFIICFTLLPPAIIPELIGIEMGNWSGSIMMLIIFAIYINKDILVGRSAAKRILGQVVIDKETGMPANEIKCTIRNFTICFWIIEVIIVMFNPNRKIGDLIAGTKVVRTDKKDIKSMLFDFKKAIKVNWILPLGIAIFYSWIIINSIIPMIGGHLLFL